jgi:hypothetical protein
MKYPKLSVFICPKMYVRIWPKFDRKTVSSLHDNLVPRVFAPRGKTLSTRLLA